MSSPTALITDRFELEPPESVRGGVDVQDAAIAAATAAFSLLPHAEVPRAGGAAGAALARLDKGGWNRDGGAAPVATPPSPGIIAVDASTSGQQETKLLVMFLLMVIVGTANKVFQKLQAIPMYNYPNSLNLIQNFVYVPLCFAYILPVRRFGLFGDAIPAAAGRLPKRPFAVMGLLDCVTCTLLTFAAVYLPGPLLILLPQAVIPISMALSARIKGERYSPCQYLGAAVVVSGILVVLEPLLSGRHELGFVCEAYDTAEFCATCGEEETEGECLSQGDGGALAAADALRQMLLASNSSTAAAGNDPGDSVCRWVSADAAQPSAGAGSTGTTLLWSVLTIFACVPMALSSIFKEQALGGSQHLDPIFLNGWVALFQLLFSVPLSVPAGMTSAPPVFPRDLPANIWDGIKCYFGTGSIEGGCHPDDHCHEAPFYVNLFLAFNVSFNILLVYILKFGSANVLFVASTVMVPLGNLAFALPFVPGATPMQDSDVAGLLVILLGLVTYRFGHIFRCGRWRWRRRWHNESDLVLLGASSDLLEEPLVSPVQ